MTLTFHYYPQLTTFHQVHAHLTIFIHTFTSRCMYYPNQLEQIYVGSCTTFELTWCILSSCNCLSSLRLPKLRMRNIVVHIRLAVRGIHNPIPDQFSFSRSSHLEQLRWPSLAMHAYQPGRQAVGTSTIRTTCSNLREQKFFFLALSISSLRLFKCV